MLRQYSNLLFYPLYDFFYVILRRGKREAGDKEGKKEGKKKRGLDSWFFIYVSRLFFIFSMTFYVILRRGNRKRGNKDGENLRKKEKKKEDFVSRFLPLYSSSQYTRFFFSFQWFLCNSEGEGERRRKEKGGGEKRKTERKKNRRVTPCFLTYTSTEYSSLLFRSLLILIIYVKRKRGKRTEKEGR